MTKWRVPSFDGIAPFYASRWLLSDNSHTRFFGFNVSKVVTDFSSNVDTSSIGNADESFITTITALMASKLKPNALAIGTSSWPHPSRLMTSWMPSMADVFLPLRGNMCS